MTELIVRYAEPKPKGIADQAVIPSEVVGTLVRCKDCSLEAGCKFTQYQGRNGYCSYGERKEDKHEGHTENNEV